VSERVSETRKQQTTERSYGEETPRPKQTQKLTSVLVGKIEKKNTEMNDERRIETCIETETKMLTFVWIGWDRIGWDRIELNWAVTYNVYMYI